MDLVRPDIDGYLAAFAAHDDSVLRRMETIAAERDFPIVGPQVGRLLEMAARSCGAQRVLELGSGFGYSAYWFLRGTGPTGTVLLTEGSAENAKSAEAYLTRGGFGGRFRIEVGDGLAIAEALEPPFDIVFCDVDKHDYPKALPIARRLVRPGGLFITDNMLWDGRVLNPSPDDHVTRGVLELTAALKSATDFAVSIVPIRDGVALATRLPT